MAACATNLGSSITYQSETVLSLGLVALTFSHWQIAADQDGQGQNLIFECLTSITYALLLTWVRGIVGHSKELYVVLRT